MPNANWTFPQQGDTYPVVCVTRQEATAYAEWLGSEMNARVRLPTGLEWEYAARSGGGSSAYSWGSTWPPPPRAANIADRAAQALVYNANETRPAAEYDDGFVYSAPVGSTTPNALGLYDMTGNVYEWVGDACSVRGGSWDDGEESSWLLTTKARNVDCGDRFSALGFRVLLEP
jgi:formylglycine-generating enzyme required for sulfatase activity